jgi:hypothetical protein
MLRLETGISSYRSKTIDKRLNVPAIYHAIAVVVAIARSSSRRDGVEVRRYCWLYGQTSGRGTISDLIGRLGFE